jgi:predicted nuclease of predicted toxin-antitoxin system
MRFLANENFPGPAVAALRSAGNDVVWVRTAAPGATDPEVLAWAAREERILITFDKDFNWRRHRRYLQDAESFCCAFPCRRQAT